jgi:hypothetical protein
LTKPEAGEHSFLRRCDTEVQDLSPSTLIRSAGRLPEGIPLRFNPAIKVARDGRLGDRLIRRDNNDWAPRLGLAYSPTNKWTIRAGAGMFYSQDTGNPRFDMARNFAGRRRDESTVQSPDLNWNAPFRNLGGTVQINNPYVLGNINERRTPVMQYMMNVQRQPITRQFWSGTSVREPQARIVASLQQSIPEQSAACCSGHPIPSSAVSGKSTEAGRQAIAVWGKAQKNSPAG